MISRGRATHYPTLTVKITGRYKAANGLGQPHRKLSTHLPQIDRLARTVRRGKRNVNCSNESSTVRVLVCFHSCTSGTRRSFKDVVRDRDRIGHAHGQWLFALIGKHHEKFGTAEVKHAVWRSRRSDAARSPR
jgi:hypothetical protein